MSASIPSTLDHAPRPRAPVVSLEPTVPRPPFRWADVWQAPLHDFPIRDEILYQYLCLQPRMSVLEMGPGSGFTAFRLARRVKRLTLVDVAPEALAQVEADLGHLGNLEFALADLSEPGLRWKVRGRFDAAFGLDVFEYVRRPETCLRNLAQVLSPGGRLLLTYPNTPPPVGDGVTYFSTASEIAELLRAAGFRSWTIFTVRMRRYPAGVYTAAHDWPLSLYRKVRSGQPDGYPQTYDRTWAFRNRNKLVALKAGVHLLWTGLHFGMRLGGPVFQKARESDDVVNRRLVIVAVK